MFQKMIRFLVPLAIAAVVACGPSKPTDGTENTPPPDEQAPAFTGGGQEGGEVGGNVYAGPYGTGIGSVIPNYRFLGYPRASLDKTTMVQLEMADFYNPTGTEVYPPGSPYGEGVAKPKAMILSRSAVWCGPCKYEAKTVIPPLRAELAPLGGEWLLILGEGPIGGEPATQFDLTKWATDYSLNYPSAVDPNGTISAIVGVDAWPGNVIIRTRDMKIVTWIAGVPDNAFNQLFRDTLDGKPVLAGD